MPRSVSAHALLALLVFCLVPQAARAQRFFRPRLVDPPAQEVTAEFVLGESGGLEPRKGTAWKVHFARGVHRGLYITGAWFKRDLNEDWIKILNDARIAELFVPYHQASFIRYYDLTSFSFPLAEVRAEDAGPFGSLMPPFQGDPFPTVVKEMRDRGVAWKDFPHGVRRGRELVLWAGLEAGNYMYLMSYSFHDDGTIAFRLGATGQNLPGHRFEAHTHSAHWRIDIDLVDGSKNSAMLMRHIEDPESLGAEDLKEPFNGGLEGGVDWDPKEFTMIRVECEKKNARNETIAYDLMPLRSGTPRHNEEFTRHDLWVSRSHPERPIELLFANLPNTVKDEEPVEQTDVVLWCNSAVHHEPRNEDGKPGSAPRIWPGDDAWEGSAIVMWSGFDLRPRNLFDRTPFYPYTPPRSIAARPAAEGALGEDPTPPSRATGAEPSTIVPERRK
jgi:Copper amine oxidase, enzyme domain